MQVRFVVAALDVALTVPGAVLAKDKSQTTQNQPTAFTGTMPSALSGPRGNWTNGTSKGKSKGVGCKVQIKLQGITGIPNSDTNPCNGDELICLADSNVDQNGAPLRVTQIFRPTITDGKVSYKVDLGPDEANIGCGATTNVVAYDSRLTCYAPDPLYSPAITVQFATDACAPHKQGVIIGAHAPRPTSNLIVTQSLFFP